MEISQRRKRAETEYPELRHREMLKRERSLKPLLDKITELKQLNHFLTLREL
ncbi:MAG: hypothetical protein M3Z64_10820 [Verrucomicrobiota bacterium]|nr:hypothetical protein [Verrucomicrobiota bacterium]